MRLVALFGFGVCVSACGSVKANVDAGTDGPACGGTVDTSGNCICPARHTPPECTACAPGWSGADCSTFSDNFNRSAGALGSNYADLTVALAEDALIVNNRACGDVQALGILDQLIDSPQISAQLSFDPGSTTGQEFNFLLSSDAALASLGDVFLAGCDGGGGTCTLKIGSASGAALAQRQLTEIIPAGSLSQATLTVDGSNNINISLVINGSIEQLAEKLPAGFTIQRLGFIVGRDADGSLSCIDDLSVQVN